MCNDLKYNKNIVINYETGEILNCQHEDLYVLYTSGFIRYSKKYEFYLFNNLDRKKVLNTIISNLKIDIKVNHEKYGNGRLSKFLSDGQITITYKTFMSLSSIASIVNNNSGMYKIIS